jgi:AraC-like DNA-binding protein
MKASAPPGLKGLFWYFPATARDERWGIYVTTVGVTHTAPHKHYPPPSHPAPYDYQFDRGRVLPVYALVYISRGRGSFESDLTGRIAVETGHVLLVFPGIRHRYMPDPNVGWDEHWVAFDGDLARRWMKECSFSPTQPVLKIHGEEALLGLYTSLIEIMRQNPAALQQIMAAKVHTIMAMLYSEQQAALGGGEMAVSVVQKAQARMQAEFKSKLDVQNLARELRVSYRWFRDAFAQRTGFSAHQYLLELRLAHARALLTQTNLRVKEIATQSGFEDEHYFSRMFKAKAGQPPSEWRLRVRGEKTARRFD